MTDQQKIDALRNALAALLRQTVDPDPIHPVFQDARKNAADVYQQTANCGPMECRHAVKSF